MGKVIWAVMLLAVLCMGAANDGCEDTSDEIQRDQQETLLKEATAQTGMPSIKNFRERKLLKDILELRDQEGLATFTYTFSEMTGEYKFFCYSVGYGIPYATQYTNPQKWERITTGAYVTIPQADPGALFSPESAEGTWVMCKDPAGDDVRPVYVEPRVIVSPFSLPERKEKATVEIGEVETKAHQQTEAERKEELRLLEPGPSGR
jgi:hypothetical protein